MVDAEYLFQFTKIYLLEILATPSPIKQSLPAFAHLGQVILPSFSATTSHTLEVWVSAHVASSHIAPAP